MLNETIARSDPNNPYSATNNQDVTLITGFTNPSQVRMPRPAVVTAASAANVAGQTKLPIFWRPAKSPPATDRRFDLQV
jgi:hypothetical protein